MQLGVLTRGFLPWWHPVQPGRLSRPGEPTLVFLWAQERKWPSWGRDTSVGCDLGPHPGPPQAGPVSGAGGPSWDGGPGVGATVMEEPLPLRGSLASQLHWKRTPPLQPRFFLMMLHLRAPLLVKRTRNGRVPPRKPPSFPDPLCALVLPLVRRAPAKTGAALSPPPLLSDLSDLYDRDPATGTAAVFRRLALTERQRSRLSSDFASHWPGAQHVRVSGPFAEVTASPGSCASSMVEGLRVRPSEVWLCPRHRAQMLQSLVLASVWTSWTAGMM